MNEDIIIGRWRGRGKGADNDTPLTPLCQTVESGNKLMQGAGMTEGWRIGHDDILDFMGKQFKVYSWRTVRRWKKRGMPFRCLWNGKPCIIENEVIKWQLKRES